MTIENAILYFDRWQRRWMIVGITAMGLCLLYPLGAVMLADSSHALTATGEQATPFLPVLESYLISFVFWMSISLGCLAMAMVHQLVHGAWGLATTRLLEAAAGTMPLMALLFVPIGLGVKMLYPWTALAGSLARESLGEKALYLNEPAFLARSVFYFLVWIFLSWWLRRTSLMRDQHPERVDRLTLRMRRLSAGGLVLLALTASFAAIDWMMSLEPHWFSSLYGGLVAIGAMLVGLSFSVAMLARVRDDATLAPVVRPEVCQDLGNLLMAMVFLWAYFAFSQYLIIWSGNTLEEIPWYLRRLSRGWGLLALAVLALHFVAPFLLLLARDRKRDLSSLAHVACLHLIIDYVNLLWMIAPAFGRRGYRLLWPAVDLPAIHWLDCMMPLAVGGLWMSCFCWQAGRRSLVSAQDPAWTLFRARFEETPHDTA